MITTCGKPRFTDKREHLQCGPVAVEMIDYNVEYLGGNPSHHAIRRRYEYRLCDRVDCIMVAMGSLVSVGTVVVGHGHRVESNSHSGVAVQRLVYSLII
jgi:hypothetical protein